MWTRLGLVIVICAQAVVASDSGCRPLSDELRSHITQYLSHRIESTSGGTPALISSALVPGTCYYKLVIRVTGTATPLTLYLSPDQRFLTSTLYDLAKDPEEEAAQVAANVRQLLMRDESPSTSGRDARITLVEFGDLQCPYCRRFAEWYRALPAQLLGETILVFKHFPLSVHPWAESAAEYTSCAKRQSAAAFWELANYLMSHQDEITPANIKDKIAQALPRASGSEVQDMTSCATTGAGPGLVARDVAVAKELGVNRTPTLYIDGRRAPPLHSEDELRRLLERELQGTLAQSAAK